MERKLTTVLAADVVGYSALMERDEAGTHERLKAGRKELFEPEIARHHGRVFKLMGDGMLAEFGSVVDAVECAVSLQRGLAERNAEVPEDQRIQVRIGINLGEVIVEGDDRYGEGVNIAARLEQLADPGGICVSGKVAKEVEKKLAFGFEPMGAQQVKNIAEPVQAFRIRLDRTAIPRSVGPAKSKFRSHLIATSLVAVLLVAIAGFYGLSRWVEGNGPPLPDKPSVAVLPFDNLSDDPQQAFFADGIAEDLMTDLSHLSGLFVIARNSSFAYKGKATDVRQVARELGVHYVVEGSVRRAGDQVRINIQLVDGLTGAHQWAERYDGAYADIFALQDKVTKAVVGALAVQLTGVEQATLSQHDTAVPGAYDSFLRGWEYYRRTTPDDYKKAIPYFERAVELDPQYGRAQAALAMVYFRSFDQRWSGSLGISAGQAFRKARDYLNLAKVHPTSTSHQVAGNVSRERGWYDDALKEFAAAIALDPSDSWSYADQAYAMIWAGRPAEAEAQIEKAMRLDPRYPPVFLFYRGLAKFAQEQMPEAAKTFEEADRLNPDLPLLRLYLAATYGLSGRVQDAKGTVETYSAARVKQGGLPFVMKELTLDVEGLWNKVPERSRLLKGLGVAKIPLDFGTTEFDGQKLTGGEIEALVFGHRLHGRDLGDGGEHGAFVSADGGSAMMYGNWSVGAGSARVEDGRLCFIWSSTTFCSVVLRNPGGTRAKENEYILLYDGWFYPFSQVE
jgi:adenylate cyclase